MEIKSHDLLASFMDLLMDAVLAVDIDGKIVVASAACERVFGYTPQEMVGKNIFAMVVPEDLDRTEQSAREVMSGNPLLYFENRYIRKDGQIVDIMWTARWSPEDQLRIGVARDITERKRAEALQAALYAISEAAYAAEDMIALFQRIHSIVGKLLPADGFSVTLYDAEKDQLSFPYLIDQQHWMAQAAKPAAGTLCSRIIESGQPLLLNAGEIAHEHAADPQQLEDHVLSWLGVPLKSPNGMIGILTVKRYLGGVSYNQKDQELLQFVSTQIATAIERQKMQARLQQLAQYDALTTLPNREFLTHRLEAALNTARREQRHLALLYLDLDKFKQVNDTLGHDAGDKLLQEVATRLKLSMRDTDMVARLGGDEFVVLLQDISSPDQAGMVVEKIRAVLAQPFDIDGHHLAIRPSIGIAFYPDHGQDRHALLKHADKVMYQEKHGEQARQMRPHSAA